MAKVLQIIDVDSDGHKVRLDDGRVVYMPHSAQHPQVGDEFLEPASEVRPPTIEQLNGEAQEQAQELSEVVNAMESAGLPEARQESEHAEDETPVE